MPWVLLLILAGLVATAAATRGCEPHELYPSDDAASLGLRSQRANAQPSASEHDRDPEEARRAAAAERDAEHDVGAAELANQDGRHRVLEVFATRVGARAAGSFDPGSLDLTPPNLRPKTRGGT